MSYQDNLVQSALNNYMVKNRADFEATKDTFLNNSFIYVDDDGEGLVALQTKTLWTNSNPTSSFAAQTITVKDMSEYDYLLFNFTPDNNTTWGFSQLFKKQLAHRLSYIHNGGNACSVRNFNILTNTTIQFENGTSVGQTANGEIIPTQIIGIKLVNSQAEVTNMYSTDETVIGRWIDGKKIYRKVLTFNNIEIGNSDLLHNIENIDYVVKYNGVMKSTNSSDNYYGYTQLPNNITGIKAINSTKITFYNYGDQFGAQTYRTWYFTLEYTKTTD